MTLFAKIKEVRKKKGITLKEVSKRTGVSVNYLSQIERGVSNPSIGIIKKISEALDVPIFGYNNQPAVENTNDASKQGQKVSVVRKNMRKMILSPKSQLRQYLLTPDFQRKVAVMLEEMDPGGEHEDEWHCHEGEKFGFVLEGRCEVAVEDKVFTLEEGDSIYFPSNLPHKFKGISEKTSKAIWVVAPPFV